jgi:hypothetical protein
VATFGAIENNVIMLKRLSRDKASVPKGIELIDIETKCGVGRGYFFFDEDLIDEGLGHLIIGLFEKSLLLTISDINPNNIDKEIEKYFGTCDSWGN